MVYNNYINAKKIFDFFLEKAAEDFENKDAQYAQQYAHLKLLRFRTEGILNSIESYKIDIQ